MAGLQSRLDEFKKEFESGGPPYNAPREAIKTMHCATAELEASGLVNKAVKVGDSACSIKIGEFSVQFLTGCECFSETVAPIPQTKAFRGANPIVIAILPTPRVPLDVQGTGPVLELDF